MVELEADQRAVVDRAAISPSRSMKRTVSNWRDAAAASPVAACRSPSSAQRLGLRGDGGRLLEPGDGVARVPLEGVDPREPDQRAQVGVAHGERRDVALPRRGGIAGQPGVFAGRELVEPDIGCLARGGLRQGGIAGGACQAERIGRLAGDGRQAGKPHVDGGTGGVRRQDGVIRPRVADASELELCVRPRGEGTDWVGSPR